MWVCIKNEFQTDAVHKISWIPGKINRADPLTESDSALSKIFLLCIQTGKLYVDIEEGAETNSAEKTLG